MKKPKTTSVTVCNLPVRRHQFKLGEFASWLAKQGAEVGVPTNPYEVIRYRAYAAGGKRPLTHIVYTKENGLLNFQGDSSDHYAAFIKGERLAGMFVSKFDPADSDAQSQGERRRAKLLERDGDECWFCGLAMGDDITIEHLVPRSAGGSNGLANYALAHAKCNHDAADMPLVKKIELRQQMRAERASK